jgi:hypothetical protein
VCRLPQLGVGETGGTKVCDMPAMSRGESHGSLRVGVRTQRDQR